MTLQEKKERIIRFIETCEDEALLQRLYDIVMEARNREAAIDLDKEPENSDSVGEPEIAYRNDEDIIYLSESEKAELQRRIDDVKAGNFLTEEEAEAEIDRLFEQEVWKDDKG